MCYQRLLPVALTSGFLLMLLACSSNPGAPTSLETRSAEEPAATPQAPIATRASQEVVFTNDSLFTVSLRRNSYGGVEVCVLQPHETAQVSYTLEGYDEIIFYPLYSVPLTRDVVLTGEIDPSRFFVRKSSSTAETNLIPAPERFEDDAVYLIFQNRSDSSSSLMQQNTFLPLISATSATTINAGETGVYKGTPRGFADLSLYHSEIPVPQHTWQEGYVYTLLFDGASIELIDGRPLHQVGQPILAVVEFQGDELAASEQALFVQAIQKCLAQTNAPARIVDATDAIWQEQLSRYAFVVTLSTEEATLPIGNRKVIRGELTVVFARNGIVLHQSEKGSFTETSTSLLMNRAATFIRDNSAFYEGLARALSE
jgi:hypothetical protein